ncbi:MAG: phospholipase D-like domain-containing protein [Alphaproteobacteria bacterium]|nr:phospholipase D-like domain-containing protein [Alphaproteobacteria bacterium]
MSSSHKWHFYLTPHEAWEAMYKDCEQAANSIDIEQYILENDAVGQRFVELLIEKAASGVKIFVICDRFGSATFYHSPLIKKLRHHGGRFYFYNIITHWDFFRPWRWFPRTHIKALLVDSRIAYTGGVCFAERMRNWRDTQIRITGPVVAQIRDAFDRAELIIRHKRSPRLLKKPDREDEFIYLQSNPIVSWPLIYTELVRAIGGAKRYVYITTPFFAPNRRFRRLLISAPAKGVTVMLLVPEHSDVRLADWVFLSYAGKFLDAGVRIFRYQKSVIHSKTVVIDDAWATIGSTNMDVLSFFRNRESNLMTTNAEAIEELKQHFLEDLKQSHELTRDQIAKESFLKIGIGYLARSMKSFI